jgi:hypothetical protein
MPRSVSRSVSVLLVTLALGLLAPASGLAQEPARRATPNRLGGANSPYLLDHAFNPVDWQPWDAESLAQARRDKKLIFLSVGYSSCHWCHVMERESFNDPEVAAYLNRHFICIKVDREERPDVDEIYLRSLQLLGSNGGWPLSMILTPEAKPIYGGTYFPPRDKIIPPPEGAPEGLPATKLTGFLTLLKTVQEAWEKVPDEVNQGAEALARGVERSLGRSLRPPGDVPDRAAIDAVRDALAEEFDPLHGGFGYSEVTDRRPKFHEPSNLLLLLELAERGDATARRVALATLDALDRGGIHDHLGGGFHRYSVDRRWDVPHFEKMLYDQAQLLTVYARAYSLTSDEAHRATGLQIIEFVERELSHADGGFLTARDADDPDGGEGGYYTWTRAELEEAAADFTDAERQATVTRFGLDRPANFEGRHVLRRHPPSPTAVVPSPERLAAIRSALRQARERRPAPRLDDKVLAGWNGLMIAGLAEAARSFDHPPAADRARRAARFVLDRMRDADGRLLRVHRAGKSAGPAFLDDYAYVTAGLIELHRTTGDGAWLDEARAVLARQEADFADRAGGGYYFTAADHESLLAKSKDPTDSALPSATAVTAESYVALAALTGRAEDRAAAEAVLRTFSGYVAEFPAATPRLARAALLWRELPAQ